MTKPDFRAVVNSRLRAERRTDLSDKVVRLLTPERPPERKPEGPLARPSTRHPVERRGTGAARRPAATPAPPAIPDGELHDPETGLLSARAWASVLQREASRFARYGQPVTLFVAEIDGLDRIAARFGDDAADGLVGPVATALRTGTRAGDVIARTGRGRFEGLLAETSESAAAGQVARVRAACNEWLASGGLEAALAAGWAQPVPGGRLGDAMELAEARLRAGDGA